VAGVDGNGQRALAEVISGQRKLSHGEIRYLGAPIGSMGVGRREKLGLRYVTDDRLGEGIVGSLPVSINLVLKRIGRAPYWRHGRMRRDAIDHAAQGLVERFDIRTPNLQTRASTLSGGNIQKLLLARELSFDAKVVVFHKPTYGLDLKTTRAVRGMIGDLREGRAALVISTDLDELLEVSDRIAVLSRGRIVGIVENGPGAAEQVGRLMIGDVTLGLQSEQQAEMRTA
jgi:simple sugar transport system ATP-binding protein